MFVKLTSGPRAGETVEMKYDDARILLADGRAVPAYPEPQGLPSAADLDAVTAERESRTVTAPRAHKKRK